MKFLEVFSEFTRVSERFIDRFRKFRYFQKISEGYSFREFQRVLKKFRKFLEVFSEL